MCIYTTFKYLFMQTKKSLHADNFLYARMNLNAYCQGELLWFKNKYL